MATIEGELVSTDDAILNSIGEGDEQTSEEGSTEENAGEEANSSEETSTASSGEVTGQGSQGEQQQAARGPQDLVDKDGNVIATGGAQRRFYETAQREKSRADASDRKVVELQGQLDAVNNAGTLGTQYDLTPEELTTGAQIINAYKEDPVGTLKYMLTQAQASGHNIDELGGQGGMDPSAIKTMINSALSPLLAEQSQRQDTQVANNAAQQQYDDFNAKFPDAKIHEASVTQLLKDDPTLSPEAAYYKLQAFYGQKGLDWNKPLNRLQAEYNAQKAKGPAENTQQQLPNGNVNANNVTDTSKAVDTNTSTGDIIKDAMAEAGYTF